MSKKEQQQNLGNHLNTLMGEMEEIRVRFIDQENLPAKTMIQDMKNYMDLQNTCQFVDSMAKAMFPQPAPQIIKSELKLVN